MHERTVVARRIILDGISNLLSAEHRGDVSKIIITGEMLGYCRDARNQYHNRLKRQNASSMQSELELKNCIQLDKEKIE